MENFVQYLRKENRKLYYKELIKQEDGSYRLSDKIDDDHLISGVMISGVRKNSTVLLPVEQMLCTGVMSINLLQDSQFHNLDRNLEFQAPDLIDFKGAPSEQLGGATLFEPKLIENVISPDFDGFIGITDCGAFISFSFNVENLLVHIEPKNDFFVFQSELLLSVSDQNKEALFYLPVERNNHIESMIFKINIVDDIGTISYIQMIRVDVRNPMFSGSKIIATYNHPK